MDHQSLKYFWEKKLPLEEHKKSVGKIQGFDFEIIHPKKYNEVLDSPFLEWKKPLVYISLHLPF